MGTQESLALESLQENSTLSLFQVNYETTSGNSGHMREEDICSHFLSRAKERFPILTCCSTRDFKRGRGDWYFRLRCINCTITFDFPVSLGW